MKSLRHRFLPSILAVGALLLGGAAHATPIGVSFNGAEVDVVVTGGSGTTWNFQYRADFTNFVANGRTHIGGINFKVEGFEPTAISLTGGNYLGTWVTSAANLNANGCGGGADSFVCAERNSGAFTPTTGIRTWNVTVTFDAAITNPSSAFVNTANPIRAWFTDANGGNRGLMSLNGAFCYPQQNCNPPGVPEPATLGLLGLGLLGFGTTRRRRPA